MKKVITPKNSPAVTAPYSHAIEKNGMLFISGQLPVNPATATVVEGGIAEQTAQVLENVKSVLTEAGYTFDDVVKTTVFLTDMANIGPMSEVYAKYYTQNFPARSTIAVRALPLDVMVEIETIAMK